MSKAKTVEKKAVKPAVKKPALPAKKTPTKAAKAAQPAMPAKASKSANSAAKPAQAAKPVKLKKEVVGRGRPTSYKPEYIKMMLDYFGGDKLCIQSQTNAANGSARQVVEYVGLPPNFWRFAADIGVHADTLYEWAKAKNEDGSLKHKDFSDAFRVCQSMQAANIFEGSMVGAYEPRMSGLAAKNLMGWSEKVETTNEMKYTMTQEEKANLDAIYANALKSAHAGRKTTALD